jgi:hypothetical protein
MIARKRTQSADVSGLRPSGLLDRRQCPIPRGAPHAPGEGPQLGCLLRHRRIAGDDLARDAIGHLVNQRKPHRDRGIFGGFLAPGFRSIIGGSRTSPGFSMGGGAGSGTGISDGGGGGMFPGSWPGSGAGGLGTCCAWSTTETTENSSFKQITFYQTRRRRQSIDALCLRRSLTTRRWEGRVLRVHRPRMHTTYQ